jgi:uncharacterized protein (DUF697 family)
MPFGLGIGQVVALVRETRGFEGAHPQISVSGEGASELALTLSTGGDAGAVIVGSDPGNAVVAIRLIDGEAAAAEIAILRRISRSEMGLIVVHRGEGHVPYVLPGDIIDAEDIDSGAKLLMPELLRSIARHAADNGPALAARLPILRTEVARRLIASTAFANAVIAASTKMQQAQMPVLTLAQSRMVLMLGLSRGDVLPRDPQQLALAAGPAVAGCIGLGFGARALVRRLPVSGRLVRAGVAYAGTRVLGEARLRL